MVLSGIFLLSKNREIFYKAGTNCLGINFLHTFLFQYVSSLLLEQYIETDIHYVLHAILVNYTFDK